MEKRATLELFKKIPSPIGPLVALLIEKGIITKEELRGKAIELSGLTEEQFDKLIKGAEKDKESKE